MQSVNAILSRILKVTDNSGMNTKDKQKVREISKEYISKNKKRNQYKLTQSCQYETTDTTSNVSGGEYSIQCKGNKHHRYILGDKENDEKAKIIGLMCTGGGIKETGDFLAIMNLDNSDNFTRRYRRKRMDLYEIINNITYEEIAIAMQDEIEATLISENGLEYYLDWVAKNEDTRDKVELTISFDFG